MCTIQQRGMLVELQHIFLVEIKQRILVIRSSLAFDARCPTDENHRQNCLEAYYWVFTRALMGMNCSFMLNLSRVF